MHIERVQIEEGFLDGVDIAFSPGLNVVFGARGTGKTSLVELIRFCLDAPNYTKESGRRSREHALSVLGSGRVVITMSDGQKTVTVIRSAQDDKPRSSGPYTKPIVLSQGEIEDVGLRPGGRLNLLDSFLAIRHRRDTEEGSAATEVASLIAEASSLRREVADLEAKLAELPHIEKQLAELAPAEEKLATISAEAAQKKSQLDAESATLARSAVAAHAIARFAAAVSQWRQLLGKAGSGPALDPWTQDGEDPLSSARTRVLRAREHVKAASAELAEAEREAADAAQAIEAKRATDEERARQLRKAIESLQTGAGATVRQGQQLRERKAELQSLGAVQSDRRAALTGVVNARSAALDRLEGLREARFNARLQVARDLSTVLGPRIHVGVTRAGQYEEYAATIAEILRGSGLHYAGLSLALAEHISPRELLEAAEANAFDQVAELSGITRDRAARVVGQLRDADLGPMATVRVEDSVSLQLLDGSNYKEIGELSTGQRCTVILPMVLRHTERIVVVDQPEDHIDNAFIAETVVAALKARGSNAQIICSTHNANIPVLGEAEWALQLGSDGRRGFVSVRGSLDDPPVVDAISTVMEGGAEAFQKRAAFYGKQKRR